MDLAVMIFLKAKKVMKYLFVYSFIQFAFKTVWGLDLVIEAKQNVSGCQRKNASLALSQSPAFIIQRPCSMEQSNSDTHCLQISLLIFNVLVPLNYLSFYLGT